MHIFGLRFLENNTERNGYRCICRLIKRSTVVVAVSPTCIHPEQPHNNTINYDGVVILQSYVQNSDTKQSYVGLL